MESLYSAFDSNGIKAFKDVENMRSREEFWPSAMKEIEESKISIILFSKNYASSIQCLMELFVSVNLRRTQGTWVVPVFYKIDPSIVKHQGGSFAGAMDKHVARFCNDMRILQAWKLALSEAYYIDGLVINDRNESEEIRRIVKLCHMLPSRIPSAQI